MDVLVALLALFVFFGAVFALFFVITRVTRAILGPRRRLEAELGLEALERRYAQGEITQEELDQAKRALGFDLASPPARPRWPRSGPTASG
jgi:uncharacterized membrane protein